MKVRIVPLELERLAHGRKRSHRPLLLVGLGREREMVVGVALAITLHAHAVMGGELRLVDRRVHVNQVGERRKLSGIDLDRPQIGSLRVTVPALARVQHAEIHPHSDNVRMSICRRAQVGQRGAAVAAHQRIHVIGDDDLPVARPGGRHDDGLVDGR